MLKVKAVDLMRTIREGLERRYGALSLQERMERMREELAADPRWTRFSMRHQKTVS